MREISKVMLALGKQKKKKANTQSVFLDFCCLFVCFPQKRKRKFSSRNSLEYCQDFN